VPRRCAGVEPPLTHAGSGHVLGAQADDAQEFGDPVLHLASPCATWLTYNGSPTISSSVIRGLSEDTGPGRSTAYSGAVAGVAAYPSRNVDPPQLAVVEPYFAAGRGRKRVKITRPVVVLPHPLRPLAPVSRLRDVKAYPIHGLDVAMTREREKTTLDGSAILRSLTRGDLGFPWFVLP